MTKQHMDLEKRTEELDSRQADMAMNSLQISHSSQELDKRAQQVQDKLVEKTFRSIDFRCAVEELVIKMARSNWDKLPPRFGVTLTPKQLRSILQF